MSEIYTKATGTTASRDLESQTADVISIWDFYGIVGDGIADDSSALSNACLILQNTGTSILVPANCRLRLAGAAQVWLSGVTIIGQGVRDTEPSGAYGNRGGTILIDSIAASPFLVSSDWGMEGLIFHSVGQTETAMKASGIPVPYKPLIVPHGTDQVVNWSFCNNQVQNALDILDLSDASAVGHFHWERNQEFACRYHLRLKSAGGESWVTNNQFTPEAYIYGDTGAGITNLAAYAQANAEMIRIEGSEGGPTTLPTTAVEGMRITDNYALGISYGLHVVGGSFNIGSMVANAFDRVPTPIAVDSYGVIEADVMGGTWLCNGSLANPQPAALSVTGGPSAAVGSTLTLTGVDVANTSGSAVVWQDPGPSTLIITGGRFANVGNLGTEGSCTGLSFNAPQGRLALVGTDITTGQTGAVGVDGVIVQAAVTSLVSGVTLTGWYAPVVYAVDPSAAGAKIHALTGCLSQGSTGTVAVSGSGAGLVAQAGNRWDVGNAYTVIQVPAGQTGGLQIAGADASIDLVISGKGAGLVDIANANLTGAPVAPTATPGTNNTQVATTAFAAAAAAAAASATGVSLAGGTVLAAPSPNSGFLIQGSQGPLLDVLPNTTAAQVNYFQFIAGFSGTGLKMIALGADINIDLGISGKGTGQVNIVNGNITNLNVVTFNVSGLPTADPHVRGQPFLLGTALQISLG